MKTRRIFHTSPRLRTIRAAASSTVFARCFCFQESKMQTLLVFLAVFSAAAVAYPKGSGQGGSDTTYPITSTEYLKMVLGENPRLVAMAIPMVSEGEVASWLESQGFQEAAKIAKQINLDKIIYDAGLDAFTLFAPNDDAVQKWKEEVRELAADKDALTRLCKAWLVPSALRSSEIVNEKVVQSMEGDILRFNIYDRTNSVTVNGCPILEIDEQVEHGLVHVVNRVIFPLPDGDVLQTLNEQPHFSTLMQLVKQAELEQELSLASKPLTMFAPTNDAFARLPRGVMADLSADKTKLQQLIRYHLARGTYYSAGLANGQRVHTMDDSMINVDLQDGQIELNKGQCDQFARITYSDLPATNGAIHVIDNVLLPRDARFILQFRG